MHTDIEEPVAFDRTPLTAAVAGAVRLRTSLSPERTFVTLPRGNPEIEPLADASERQGATIVLRQEIEIGLLPTFCQTLRLLLNG